MTSPMDELRERFGLPTQDASIPTPGRPAPAPAPPNRPAAPPTRPAAAASRPATSSATPRSTPSLRDAAAAGGPRTARLPRGQRLTLSLMGVFAFIVGAGHRPTVDALSGFDLPAVDTAVQILLWPHPDAQPFAAIAAAALMAAAAVLTAGFTKVSSAAGWALLALTTASAAVLAPAAIVLAGYILGGLLYLAVMIAIGIAFIWFVLSMLAG